MGKRIVMTNKKRMTEKNHKKPVRIAGIPANYSHQVHPEYKSDVILHVPNKSGDERPTM
jgi:hypothetical protein